MKIVLFVIAATAALSVAILAAQPNRAYALAGPDSSWQFGRDGCAKLWCFEDGARKQATR